MAEQLNTKAALEQPWARDQVESAARAAVAELVRACGKFPTFPSQFCLPDLDTVRRHLVSVRLVNDGKSEVFEQTAFLVLDEELSEMMEATLMGDLEAARTEAVQAMAMLLRIYIHLPEFCDQARGEVAR